MGSGKFFCFDSSSTWHPVWGGGLTKPNELITTHTGQERGNPSDTRPPQIRVQEPPSQPTPLSSYWTHHSGWPAPSEVLSPETDLALRETLPWEDTGVEGALPTASTAAFSERPCSGLHPPSKPAVDSGGHWSPVRAGDRMSWGPDTWTETRLGWPWVQPLLSGPW